MKFYLSSYKLGDEAQRIPQLLQRKKLGYIPNAMDFTSADVARVKESIAKEVVQFNELGIEVELLDLREYFGKSHALQEKLKHLGGVWVRGGNTFVLRRAMRLSGFDEILSTMGDEFLYAGYSAGVCVLAPSMESLQQVDDPKDAPYPQLPEPIWEGLGLLDYMILPHYKSDHPESADIDKEVEYCKRNNIPYKPLRDGEVIILE